MDPGHERAAIVRAAGDVGEPRPGVRRQRGRHLDPLGLIGEPRPRDHEPRVARLTQGGRDLGDLRPGAALLVHQEQRLVAGTAQDVLGDVPEAGPAGVQHDDPRAGGRRLPQSEVQDGNLLLGVQARDEDHLRSLHVAIRHAHPAGSDLSLDGAGSVVAPVVEVVRAEHCSGELRERVVVLVHQPAAGQHADARAVHPARDGREHLAERGRLEPVVPDQRRRDPLGRVGEPERVAALVADPRVVHLVLVAREVADDLAAPEVDPDVAAGRAVRADRVAVRQIERPGGEPVRRGRQRPDRADLHGVAAERRPEVFPGRDRDALPRSPRVQLKEAVARDLVAEPGAARAEDATLPVERHQRRQRDRLLEDALRLPEPAVPRPVREGLVLERALAAAIADRAVERVVQQAGTRGSRAGRRRPPRRSPAS